MASFIAHVKSTSMVGDKEFFVMFSLIIPGKELIEDANMDTQMAPLIEELQELWRGVISFDVLAKVGKQTFKLYSCGLFMTFQLMDLQQDVILKATRDVPFVDLIQQLNNPST